VVDHPVADRDGPLADLLEAGDHPQSRRLATAKRPDDDDELAVANREGEVVDARVPSR
jgi:hypothetical protein